MEEQHSKTNVYSQLGSNPSGPANLDDLLRVHPEYPRSNVFFGMFGC